MQAKFYEPKYKDSKILAFADVSLSGGITIKGFRVVDGEKGLFGAVPQKTVTVDGKTQYFKQVFFDTNEHREEFMAKLLDDYQAWRQNQAQERMA